MAGAKGASQETANNGNGAGMPLTIAVQLMSSAAGFRARTSASPAMEQDWQASAAGYGKSSPELLGKFDHATRSLKTSQLCFLEGSETFSTTYPRSGMMRNGTVFQLPPLVRLTDATGSGLWRTPDASVVTGGAANAEDRKKQGHAIGLHDQVNTPSMWPTPQAQDYKSGTGYSHDGKSQTPQLRHLLGGMLNPTWVEWLMGFPLGWTALEPLATLSSRKSRKS